VATSLAIRSSDRKSGPGTFRGTTWRSIAGLESERQVFARYKARRAAEREYVPA